MEKLVNDVFDGIAETDQPVSTVDVERAMRLGERKVWLRRAGAVGGALGVVVVIAVTTTLVAGGFGADRRSFIGDPSSSGVSASVAPKPPDAFDPKVLFADFGWLPDGLDARGVTSTKNMQLLLAEVPMSPAEARSNDAAASRGVHLIVTAAADHGLGRPWAGTGPVVPSGSSGTDVTINGHPGQLWQEGGTVNLGWQYVPGHWAQVTVGGLPGDLVETATKVARGVRFGVNTTIGLPVHPTGLPPSFDLDTVTVRRLSPDADAWFVSVAYQAGRGSSEEPQVLAIGVFGAGALDFLPGTPGKPNTTVDGHPARRGTSDGMMQLEIFDVDGVDVGMGVSASAVAAIDGGLEGLFRRLHLESDPRSWR